MEYIAKRQSFENKEYQEEGSINRYGDKSSKIRDSDFYRAVKASDIQKVRALILGAKDKEKLVNSKYYRDENNYYEEFESIHPLYTAVENNNIEIVKLIVENGGDSKAIHEECVRGDIYIVTPLELAMEQGYIEIRDYLQSKNFSDNLSDNY